MPSCANQGDGGGQHTGKDHQRPAKLADLCGGPLVLREQLYQLLRQGALQAVDQLSAPPQLVRRR
jgi:hypothetical protein